VSVLRGKTQRRIVPRWRTSSSRDNVQELDTLKAIPVATGDDGQHAFEASRTFESYPSVGAAADLLAASSMASDEVSVARAVAFLLRNESLAPKALTNLAKSIQLTSQLGEKSTALATDSSDVEVFKVSQLRQLARLDSDNPLVWSDLARHYASIGDRRKADRCMRTALKLAPNHRWILRTAARFFVHSGDPIAAHSLLAKHPYTNRDPWLLAAEIATAQVAQRAPKFWGQAVDHIKWSRFAPVHLSELATAIAMFELEDGRTKSARRLVERALIAPTENTLAQVSWARQNRNLNDANELSVLARKNERAFEARYGILLGAGSILQAQVEGKRWAIDEPFATRPRAGLAFIAAMLDDHVEAIRLTNEVRRIDRQVDHTLDLNSVFAELSSGHLSNEADKPRLDAIRAQLTDQSETDDDCHALANLALWQYRYGDAEEGRRIYERAILRIEKTESAESAALAATFAARESILARQAVASVLMEKANLLAERSRSEIVKFYLRKLEALVKAPDKSNYLLSPASARSFTKQ
jgi:tetratricopeptide (TPR) repeat protein